MEIESTIRAFVEWTRGWELFPERIAVNITTEWNSVGEEQGMGVAEMISLFKFMEFDKHTGA